MRALTISLLDLSSFTRTAGFTASNPCRTASLKQTRNTFRLRLAVERESSFASRSRNRAMSLACNVERSRLAFAPEKSNEAFDDALVTGVRGLLRFDFFRLQPRLAPRFDGRARERFDVGRREHSLTPCAMTSRAAPRSVCRCAL